MAAASGGLLFVNGIGAIAGPPIMGALMSQMGPGGFWLFLAVILAVLTGYGLWRMTQRPTVYGGEDAPEVVSPMRRSFRERPRWLRSRPRRSCMRKRPRNRRKRLKEVQTDTRE